MKKLPLVFCCLFFCACSSKKIINNQAIFDSHPQPFRVSSIGKWDNRYVIYTLTDAHNIYFTVKDISGKALKKGDVYAPNLSIVH
ncbi:hypothetical protein [Mucilaginibacter panaciglaebae]|uniref:hypothetical protein n=1 Tax=Mucilaginibacter panaciglaebae TaxID=502331 RepID=UPI0031EEA640